VHSHRLLNLNVRRSMNLSVSRVASLIVVAVAYITAWPTRGGFWVVTLVCGPLLWLIWFPQEVDDFTFGDWSRAPRLTPTPRAFS
jgi:hypothetical protein